MLISLIYASPNDTHTLRVALPLRALSLSLAVFLFAMHTRTPWSALFRSIPIRTAASLLIFPLCLSPFSSLNVYVCVCVCGLQQQQTKTFWAARPLSTATAGKVQRKLGEPFENLTKTKTAKKQRSKRAEKLNYVKSGAKNVGSNSMYIRSWWERDGERVRAGQSQEWSSLIFLCALLRYCFAFAHSLCLGLFSALLLLLPFTCYNFFSCCLCFFFAASTFYSFFLRFFFAFFLASFLRLCFCAAKNLLNECGTEGGGGWQIVDGVGFCIFNCFVFCVLCWIMSWSAEIRLLVSRWKDLASGRYNE